MTRIIDEPYDQNELDAMDAETTGNDAPRKFYKTTVSIDVLSEGPLDDCMTLSEIDYAITHGDCVGGNMRTNQVELTPKQAADALHEVGSDPTFFSLDDKGNAMDDD